MAVFHRLSVPSYFGGLPGGFDYINNAIAGTPAFADGVKGAGPNVGTYFIAFGEDGTSSDANRPAKALAQNTDYLDDLLHRDIAVPTRTVDVTPGVPVASVLFGAGTYVGAAGTPNTPAGINSFVEITDDNDKEIIIPATGQKCQVTSITGPAVGSGFSPGAVTFNISPSIPTGQTYRLYYAQRGNLATLPDDALTSIKIRGAQEIPAAFEDFQKQISRMSGSNVLALVASIIETPDGVRLAKDSTLRFDADPDGSQAFFTGFLWRVARDAASRVLARLRQDAGFDTGITGTFTLDANMALGFLGQGWLYDNNTVTATAQNGGKAVPFSSSTASKGDAYMRVFDHGKGTQGLLASSIIQKLNAQYVCTVGDGVSTFGDFNGADAVKQALDFATTAGLDDLVIQVKRGVFTSATLVLGAGQVVLLEGIEGGTVIAAATAGATITMGSGASLRLKNIWVNAGAGQYAINATAAESLYFDRAVVSGSVRAENMTSTSLAHVVHGRQSTFTNSTGYACFEGVHGIHTRGWLFEDCGFTPVGQPPFRVKMGTQTLGVTALHDGIDCVDCRFTLGSTALTTGGKTNGVLTTNTGLVDFDPNTKDARLGTEGLRVLALRFIRSRVYANASLDGATADNVVLHLIPTPNGVNAAASTSQYMSVDDLVFDGTYLEFTLNRWAIAAGPWAHGVSPFTCTAATNVHFINACRVKINQNTTVVAGYDQMNGFITDDAAYGFGTGAVAVPGDAGGAIAIGATGQLNIEDLRCDGWVQGATTPDVRLYVEDIQVRKWKNTYVAHAGVKRPFCRMLFTACTSGTSHGVIEDLELVGATTVANDWFSGSVNGAVVVSGYLDSKALRLVRPVIHKFRDSGGVTSAINGILLQDTLTVAALTGLAVSGGIANVHITGGYLERLGNGVRVVAENAALITSVIVDGVKIARCGAAGVLVAAVSGAMASYVEPLEVRNCNITLCTALGISIVLDLSLTSVRVQNNYCYNNNAGVANAQILIGSTDNVTHFCRAYLYGNVTVGGKIQLYLTSGGVAAISPTSQRDAGQVYGAETGMVALASHPSFNFTPGDPMIHNDAFLMSP